jgi:uncharacterized membrane protein YqjE
MTPRRDEDPAIADLVADAVSEFGELLRGEVALARAEIERDLRKAVTGGAMLAVAAILALVALDVFAAAIVVAVTEMGLEPGWAALAVGIAFALLAVLFWRLGAKAIAEASLLPDRTARNLQRDATTIREAMSHEN